MKKCKSTSRYSIGIVVLVAGVVFLGKNLGFIPQEVYGIILQWPMILIAISFISFLKAEWFAGFLFLAIGGYFLLPDFIPGFTMREVWKFWPLLLIVFGFAIMRGKKQNKITMAYHIDSKDLNSDDLIDEVAIFGGNVTRVTSPNFKGGEVTSIFGGSEINFTDAKLAEGGAVIEMSAIFGGVKLIVPRDWHIKVEISSILGGFEDKRSVISEHACKSKTLLIKGVTIFGGGELISY